MKTIHFNTGRKYTVHGQRISATLHDDGTTVTFMDHDRMVHGQFYLNKHCSFDRNEVMHWYDGTSYQQTSQSYIDGMQAGGPNVQTEFQRFADAERRYLAKHREEDR